MVQRSDVIHLPVAGLQRRLASSCSSIPGATAQKYRLTSTDMGAHHSGCGVGYQRRRRQRLRELGADRDRRGARPDAVARPPSARHRRLRQRDRRHAPDRVESVRGPATRCRPSAYQWQRCKPGCANIAGAAADSYKLHSADKGARIRVVVSATNTVGAARANSTEVGPVTPAGPSQRDDRRRCCATSSPQGQGRQDRRTAQRTTATSSHSRRRARAASGSAGPSAQGRDGPAKLVHPPRQG